MMAQTPFEHFHRLVLQDVQLQEKLRELTDRAAFIRQVVAVGEEHGYCFTTEDVTIAMQANRRTWLEQWTR